MRFRDISISWKLTLFAVGTTLLSMVAVISTVAMIDRRLSQVAMVENYVTMADVVCQSCIKALEASDFPESQDDLLALRKDRQIVMACLFQRGGEICARIQTPAGEFPTLDQAQQMNGTFSPDGFLHLIRPIHRLNGTIGHLYLRISSEKLITGWWDQLLLVFSLFCLSMLMAVALATRLQRFISHPVLHLVDTAQHITNSGDFSIRAEKETGDELGELVDRFNEMLNTIQARDEELERHQQNLEELVRERTIELEEKTNEAMAASVAKSAFLANMSHEIRTPMNAILGFAHMLRQGNYENENERVEFLDTICTSGQHLLGVINNILDLSKIEAGCLVTETISVSPHQLIADVISITRVNALSKGLGLDYNWIGPVPKFILTDPAKFRQLLINLIGNAIKFTEKGGVHVVARLMAKQKNLQIQVIDTGIGVPADKLDTIFTPFSQADASMTRRFGGTGLGLSISRKIAVALGGSLIVESQLGVGSTFTATIATGEIGELHLRGAPPVADVIPASEADDHEPKKSAPKGCRVLLVEDGDINRRLICKMLNHHGIEVLEAVNGQIGVDLATTHEFDVILMDMQMPIKDGYTAAKELRAKGLSIPIVALTAHAMTGDEEKCRNAGCSDYLTKPIEEDQLLAKITELLIRGVAENQTDSRRSIEHPKLGQTTDQLLSAIENSANSDAGSEIRVACALPLEDEAFREIIQEFSVKLSSQVERMKLAYEAEDWNELVELGHWLKGSGGTAGYEQFTIPSGRLERLASQHSHDKIEPVLREIEQLAKAVARELDSLPVMK